MLCIVMAYEYLMFNLISEKSHKTSCEEKSTKLMR